jgi:hypothetical protein
MDQARTVQVPSLDIHPHGSKRARGRSGDEQEEGTGELGYAVETRTLKVMEEKLKSGVPDMVLPWDLWEL